MKGYRKSFLIICVIINVVIISGGSFVILNNRQRDIVLESIPLCDWLGDFSKDGYFNQNFPSSKYWFSGKTGVLEKGVYNVSIYYEANSDHFYLHCDSDADGNKYPAILADTYLLDSEQKKLSFQVWVNDKIDFLRVIIECGETDKIPAGSYLHLDKIEVSRNFRGTLCYEFLKLILRICILDGILIIYARRDKIRDNFYVVFGLSAILMASSLELFTQSQIRGHDLIFHLGRIMGLKESLTSGSFPVRMQTGWCNDYGYASSVFYGDILLYVPAVLYGLKVPLIYVYKIYMLMINLGTLIIAYYSFKRISKDKYIGITCTACYCLSINRILNVYLRAAVGEYSAFMFLPLIVLGMWEILVLNPESEGRKHSWLFLTLGMTGVIQTHTLSFEMVGIFLGVVCLFSIKRVLHKNVFLSFCKAVSVTLCLNLGFLFPFLDYAREDLRVFSEKETYGIQWYGLSLYELFSIGTTATGEAQSASSGLSYRFPVSIGLVMVMLIATAIILLAKDDKWTKEEKKQLMWVLLLAGMALYLSTYYFPWNKIAGVGMVKNVVSSIQFPWRFLSIAMPILTLVSCLTLMHIKKRICPKYLQYIMLGICVLTVYQGLQCMDRIARNSDNYVKYDGSHLLDVKETFSGGEYLYTGTDIDKALKDTGASGKNLQELNMDKEDNQIDIQCIAGKNAYIEVPLFAYPYYQCIDVETGERYAITRGNNNKIRVELPNDYDGNLRIFFKEPWYWRGAEIFSALTFVFLLIYILRIKIKRTNNGLF